MNSTCSFFHCLSEHKFIFLLFLCWFGFVVHCKPSTPAIVGYQFLGNNQHYHGELVMVGSAVVEVEWRGATKAPNSFRYCVCIVAIIILFYLCNVIDIHTHTHTQAYNAISNQISLTLPTINAIVSQRVLFMNSFLLYIANQ